MAAWSNVRIVRGELIESIDDDDDINIDDLILACVDWLHSYNALTNEMTCYNIVSSGVVGRLRSSSDVLSGELAVPTRPGCTAARSHCAVNLLGQ